MGQTAEEVDAGSDRKFSEHTEETQWSQGLDGSGGVWLQNGHNVMADRCKCKNMCMVANTDCLY